jgi:hypothetical protein
MVDFRRSLRNDEEQTTQLGVNGKVTDTAVGERASNGGGDTMITNIPVNARVYRWLLGNRQLS